MTSFKSEMLVVLLFCAIKISFASACTDSLYLELKKRDINSLTQNEMSYLLSKDELCDQEKKDSAALKTGQVKPVKDSTGKDMKFRKTTTKVGGTILFVLLICAAVTLIAVFGGGALKG
jgi:hypothetical protein